METFDLINTIIKYIFYGIILIVIGYIVIRVCAFGIAKSVIEAIQQLKIKTNKEGEEKWYQRKDKR